MTTDPLLLYGTRAVEAVCGTGEFDVTAGETLSVDGDRGLIARGALPLTPAADDPVLKTFMEWRDAHRR